MPLPCTLFQYQERYPRAMSIGSDHATVFIWDPVTPYATDEASARRRRLNAVERSHVPADVTCRAEHLCTNGTSEGTVTSMLGSVRLLLDNPSMYSTVKSIDFRRTFSSQGRANFASHSSQKYFFG